jgi:hypothetical protein
VKQNKHEIGLEIGPRRRNIIEPTEIFIGRSKATDKLYDAEEVRAEAIKSCAKEWAKVHGADVEDKDAFWNHIIPQALFDTLESYSPAAAIVAAEAFLKQFGWKIERPQPETGHSKELLERAAETWRREGKL